MRSWLLILALTITALPAVANAWWDKDWSYRKAITLDASPKGANIPQQIGRMPVLVRLHSGNFTFADAQDSGADLRFIGADDKTPLAFHIESFDPLLGMGAVWVDVADLPAGGGQKIWLYYGNKKATPSPDAGMAFDPDYTLVYHFDSPAGTPTRDATAYGSNAGTAPAGLDQAAIIAKGAKFTGAGALTIPASAALNIAAGGPFTFSTWVKVDAPQARAALYARRDGGGSLVIGLDQNVPFVEVGAARLSAPMALPRGQWSHLAVTADGKTITLYINGKSVGAAPAALPALGSPTVIGADAQATGGLAAFVGEMDEVRISKIGRPAALIAADFAVQGPDAKFVAVADKRETDNGFSFGYFGIIIKSVTIDAWAVIAILGVLAAASWYVMWDKAAYVGRVDKANDAFLDMFRQHADDPLGVTGKGGGREQRTLSNSSLYRIYKTGADELHRRAGSSGRPSLKPEGVEVVRSLMNSATVREMQHLNRSMVVLTIAISGGPFLGLLGTVVGVMITFAAIAASGDVNINAIAPGISAALLATVTGLAVAIPALFGYNYIQLRNKDVTSNMQVFVDEFVTRISELYRSSSASLHVAAAE